MARSRPSLSITLPSNFEFHYKDGQLPKTPEQNDEQQSVVEPPPPPRQTYKLKRRRVNMVSCEEPPLLPDPDTVIPTIEMSEAVSEMSSPTFLPTSSPSDGLLAPLPTIQRLVTPPKTPAPQIIPFADNSSPANEWELINDIRDNKRPSFQRSASMCSSFSDSSVSSCGSSAFSAPHGSCTSPESVATDPFIEDDVMKAEKLSLSPDMRNSPTGKRVKRHRHVKWTPEMDQHLENTYITYLRDPKVTPFKTLPGMAPPLGVCSRVANKARRTWSQHRATTPTPLDMILETVKPQHEGSPDTIRPETTGNNESKWQPQWPRSDAATRRRLRKLVKSKPALSAHYQRLLRTRSPSPFTSLSAPGRSSEPTTSFSGRDMTMSLITSTAPSMQSDGPLAQLASDESTADEAAARPPLQRATRPAGWFDRIGRSQAHHKSLSLQSDLGLGSTSSQPTASLASPFDEASNRSHLLHSMSTTKSLGRKEFSHTNAKAPSLDSPIEMTGAPTLPRSLKRRFKSDEEKPRRPALEDVFGQSSEDVGVVRNRGFSVGAVRATDTLAKLAEPTVTTMTTSRDQEMSEAPPPPPDMSNLGPIGSRSAPRRLAAPVPRLGSPFTGAPPNGSLFNTFPRSYVPSSSNPQPFQDRLRELATQHIHL